MKLSLIIPCRDVNDPKLKELLKSIDEQDFPKEELETLIITEGTSESAKAIGIRQAKGEVIGILASDNELIEKDTLTDAYETTLEYNGASPHRYFYTKYDNCLNRYFALIGGNDPLSFYMRKNDRMAYFEDFGVWPNNHFRHNLSWGDNGFFVRKSLIEKTDLDNYYHVDNANEALKYGCQTLGTRYIWHKTGGNIFQFFAKRYRYGLQHAFNKNRRWHLVDFRQPKDVVRLIWFIVCSVTIMEPLCLSIRGYLKVRDIAWFMHPLVSFLTVLTYGLLSIHIVCRTLFQSLFARMVARRA